MKLVLGRKVFMQQVSENLVEVLQVRVFVGIMFSCTVHLCYYTLEFVYDRLSYTNVQGFLQDCEGERAKGLKVYKSVICREGRSMWCLNIMRHLY